MSDRIDASDVATQTVALVNALNGDIQRTLGPELAGVRSMALVDFPDHSNVGDSAIYLGEIRWLRQNHIVPGYVSSMDDYSPSELRKSVPEGPIFIHGGGNLGDIWPDHQRFREAIIADFPDRRIVQLPQTIHFTDAAALGRMAKLIADHGNFLLLVRDRTSLDVARSSFACDVRLCPDMALALGMQPLPARARHQLVLLLRTDIERAALPPYAIEMADALVCDWLEEPRRLRESIRWRSAICAALASPADALDRSYQRERLYMAIAQRRFLRGLRLLASGSGVITDRLHGHILCLLLGLPHIVFDNSYGKLGSFITTWTETSRLVGRAQGPQDALECWDRLRGTMPTDGGGKRGRAPWAPPDEPAASAVGSSGGIS